MKPIHWILSWVNPLTGNADEAIYFQRARANGMRVILKAKGMQNVVVTPKFTA